MKKTILHFIFDLGRGGAETMLVRVIKALPEYKHIVVTLYPYNKLADELECDLFVCLNQGSLFFFPITAWRFNKLVRKYKVDLVHTHLFWPTVIGRFAVPKDIPLVTTIHAFIKTSVEYKNWHIRFLDKLSYRFRKSIIIAVAKGAQEEYFSFLNLRPHKTYVLYTFVDSEKFILPALSQQKTTDGFKVVTVGALRLQKNHEFLIKAFAQLKEQNISLEIFGVGPLQQKLQKLINNNPGVKVTLKGEVANINEIIPRYDLFVMASSFEGFSLSVLEAMAMKMPLLLSDISSFREQCEGVSIFFAPDNSIDFIKKLHSLLHDKLQLKRMGEKGYEKVICNFTLSHHINGLLEIYDDAFRGV